MEQLNDRARQIIRRIGQFADENGLGEEFIEPALQVAEATRADGTIDTSLLSPETQNLFHTAMKRRRQRLTAADGTEEAPLPDELPED